jgi:hypothetical protein
VKLKEYKIINNHQLGIPVHTLKYCEILCFLFSVRNFFKLGYSRWFTMNLPSVHSGDIPPLGGESAKCSSVLTEFGIAQDMIAIRCH